MKKRSCSSVINVLRVNPARARRTPPLLCSHFTLIELLAALALAIIIAGAAMTAFTQTISVGSLANARIDALHNARSAMTTIENDLKAAYIGPKGELFLGNNPEDEGAVEAALDALDEDVHSFLRLRSVSGQGGVNGPARVAYYWWTENGDPEQSTLFRSAKPVNSDETPVPESESDDVIAFNVIDLRVRFYSEHQDHDDPDIWDSFNDSDSYQYRRLPLSVEVVISTVDDKGILLRQENEPVRIRRVIELEAGMTR